MINVSRMGVWATYLNLRSRECGGEVGAGAGAGPGWNQIILMAWRRSALAKPGNNPFIGIMKDYLLFILILKDNQCKVFHGQ